MRSKFAFGTYIDGMRSKTLKWIVLTATLLIIVIVGVQLYWLNKIYSLEQKTFNMNVVKSIRGLYEDVDLVDSPVNHLQDYIEHPSPDYFLFRTGIHYNKDSLIWYLKDELNDFDVLTDAHIGFYDSGKRKYVSREYITAAAARYDPVIFPFPVYERPHHYVLIYFPHRNKYVLSQMNFWFISSAVLLIVLIGLAISLFYFYRQKFLAEIQKDFVNNFTHEFKTPLAVMKISSEVLLQEKIIQQPERLHQYAMIIQNQTMHLQKQVERLLQVATTERKELPIQKSIVPVNGLLEEAIAKIQPLAEEKDASLEMQLPENEKLELMADRAHLELAIVNLLENALKYAPHPKIIVSAGKENDLIFISIKDNGIGIDKKFHKRLFEKFYRVPTGDVHNVKGFGLGLSFVKRVIDAHHGTITINSIPGIGTEFKMLLPGN